MNTKEPGSVEQKGYEMPPRDGFTIAHFLTVVHIDRSARFYETVFGGVILSRGDSSGAPAYVQIANTWLLVNVGGGPTPDKPTVTLSVPDPNKINSFMNIRVADIQACYELWKSRSARWTHFWYVRNRDTRFTVLPRSMQIYFILRPDSTF